MSDRNFPSILSPTQPSPPQSNLPHGFVFSQSSLQDFTDCHRRFQLRHMQKLVWPALQAEPALDNERLIQRGDRFHRMAQQYLLGIPSALLEKMALADPDPLIADWWENFVETIPLELAGQRHVERSLRALAGPPPLDSVALIAVFDLILLHEDGRACIYDWKTSSHRPKRHWLEQRLQTRVYPYLLAKAGAVLNGGIPIAPDQIEMVYWFADPQHQPERFAYSERQFHADEEFLQALIRGICELPQNEFSMAPAQSTCRYCNYRSLCSRGIQAGAMDDEAMAGLEAQPEDLDFGLEQIGEIAF